MATSSDEILAEVLVPDRKGALRYIQEWLRTHAPGESVVLHYRGGDAIWAGLPAVWIFSPLDFTHQHDQVPAQEFRVLDFNLAQLTVVHHKLLGPLPKNPLQP